MNSQIQNAMSKLEASARTRTTPVLLALASLPAGTFQYVAGVGLYVNLGTGNPGSHALLVSRRAYGFRVSSKSWVRIDGFSVVRQNDRCIYLTGPASNDAITNNVVQ